MDMRRNTWPWSRRPNAATAVPLALTRVPPEENCAVCGAAISSLTAKKFGGMCKLCSDAQDVRDMTEQYSTLERDIETMQKQTHSLEHRLAVIEGNISSLERTAQELGDAPPSVQEALDQSVEARVHLLDALEHTDRALQTLMLARIKTCEVLRRLGAWESFGPGGAGRPRSPL